MDDLKKFPCTACGLCCRHITLNEQTMWLNRGDGICKHLDEKKNLCLIYDKRPLVCRVEDYYKVYFINKLSWNDFIQLNQKVCQKFQSESEI